VSAARSPPDEREAEVVREIFRVYVTRGAAKAVARTLNQRGLRYRTGLAWDKGLVLDVDAAVGDLLLGSAQRRRRARARRRAAACSRRSGGLRPMRCELPARDIGEAFSHYRGPQLRLQDSNLRPGG
jgi:hypothetical protein